MLSSLLAMSDDGLIIVNVGSSAVFGIICALVANSRGRSALGWFFVGFFTTCIGLILVLVLPDVKQEQERSRRTLIENRKLREQLQKERQISDQRHEQVERRLGAHDEALGLDTSQPPAIADGPGPAQLTGGPAGTGQWYYARDNERQGPVSEETIRHLIAAKVVASDTLVWTEGMEDWATLDRVETFRGDLS